MHIIEKTKYEKKYTKIEKLFNWIIPVTLLAIFSVIPFYSEFKDSQLVYIMKYIFLALFIFIIFKSVDSRDNFKEIINLSIILMITSFLNSFYVINMYGGQAFVHSIASTLIFLLVGVLGTFYFAAIDFEKFKNILLTFLIVIFLTVNIPGLLSISNSLSYYSYEGRFRFTGIFDNSNEMSRFALLGYLLAIRLWTLYKGLLYKTLFTAISASSIYLVYLSDSRASLLVILLSFVALAIIVLYKNISTKLFLSIFFIIVSLVISILLYIFASTFDNFGSLNLASFSSGRVSIWASVFDTSFLGLIFGVGSMQDIGIHNGYIEIIKYYGLVGFLVWMILIVYLVIKKIKNTFRVPTTSNLIGLLIVFLFLFYHIFEGALIAIGNLVIIYFWLEIAQKNKVEFKKQSL